MVSDWQGGDISKLFPALSGKEDLSMGEDKKAAFVPIISEDIRKKIAEGDTFDNEGLSA